MLTEFVTLIEGGRKLRCRKIVSKGVVGVDLGQIMHSDIDQKSTLHRAGATRRSKSL